ncbi:death effector domain-containing protein [Parasteatoda tepidariorum]|uniref:death effector domain-containing protein n=1 Tax=Parasteatoda tepidariorum TaxID=114398 RepID=UPI00077F9C5C|nr:death effector domain-containing protein [Parasteatoda tepidariorum]
MAADSRYYAKITRNQNSRHESTMFKICDRVGSHLSQNDVHLLTILSGNVLDSSTRRKIKNGKDLFLALSKEGHCDESNFESILEMLKIIRRHDLLHMFTVKQKPKVTLDPVEEYLKNIGQIYQNVDALASYSQSNQTLRISGNNNKVPSTPTEDRINFPTSESSPAKRLRRSQRISNRNVIYHAPSIIDSSPTAANQKYTCDVRLRVRAEYCNYQSVLQGNVSSVKADPVERQLECFTQASAILRARDLGYIVCDIKFSEITYLDAFWRDYLNGSLLEALKGVFITESLKQAVGNEAIKLLVNVDESDYEKGRDLLMKNLHLTV